MTEHSLWRFSRALHAAINERQLDDLEPLIDEDIEWSIFGPIDMFPFLGARAWQGRGAGGVPADRRAGAGAPLRSRVGHARRRYRGLDDALFADVDGVQPADQPAARAFRAVSRRAAVAHPRGDRHFRPCRAGAGPTDPSAADRVVDVVVPANAATAVGPARK